MNLLSSFKQALPILILISVISFVLIRLPSQDLGHSQSFKRRRAMNWLSLGMTYAFLYMGRYNLTVGKNAMGDLISNSDFATIFFWGTLVYGFSFVINGPLTDRFGGARTMLVAALGSALMNICMGFLVQSQQKDHLVTYFSILYGLNMYFQSFGAVAIVKVNAAWFHLKERGTFGGIFGILISLGVYFAYDWGNIIVKNFPIAYVFFIPAMILIVFLLINALFVRDLPSQVGHPDFDTADGTNSDLGQALPVLEIGKKMITNPIILTIALIEFCSGFLRNAVMQWYIIFSKQTGTMANFIPSNWGLILCCAGILGGVFAGTVSDRLFQSRRGPVSAVLYGLIVLGAVTACFALQTSFLDITVVFMSISVIGVHGMLSGTMSMDFGGKRNVGIAVGLIDGMVYLGTAAQSLLYGSLIPNGEAAKVAANWYKWPIGMVPFALIGFILALRLWNATPHSKPKLTT